MCLHKEWHHLQVWIKVLFSRGATYLYPLFRDTSDLYLCFSLWSTHAKWYIHNVMGILIINYNIKNYFLHQMISWIIHGDTLVSHSNVKKWLLKWQPRHVCKNCYNCLLFISRSLCYGYICIKIMKWLLTSTRCQ